MISHLATKPPQIKRKTSHAVIHKTNLKLKYYSAKSSSNMKFYKSNDRMDNKPEPDFLDDSDG